jgi:hypothetical protein
VVASRERELERLQILNKAMARAGLVVLFDLETAEALSDEDLHTAVQATSHALAQGARVMGEG